MDGENKSKEKTKINEWGAFIGYKFPLFLRFYAGYIFGAYFESEENKEDQILFGTGPKIGLGFSILPLVSLNLEWRNIKYEPSHKSEKIDDYVISYRVDSKYSALMVSLSIPLNL